MMICKNNMYVKLLSIYGYGLCLKHWILYCKANDYLSKE
jgi:hypothetical protein